MNRFSTIKPADLSKGIGFLKGKNKKKGISLLEDSEDDYEYEHYGDRNSASTASGNTAEENFGDWNDPAVSHQQPSGGRRPARRASLAEKLVGDWAMKKKNPGRSEPNDDAFFGGYEDGAMDDMSVNYGNDDVSVDASRCDTYLEDDSKLFQAPESPMSALRKGQKSKKKTKQVKKAMETMSTLDEGTSDEEEYDDDDSTKGGATYDESSSSGNDEYDSFFAYLDKNQDDDDGEEPVESDKVKKTKKKKKPKKKADGATGAPKKKKKKKKVKKKKADDSSVNSSDLLGMVSPDAPKSPKTIDEEILKSEPIAAPPDLSLDEPNRRVDHHAARRALARLNQDNKGGLGGLSLDNKMGDARVDRAARRAIRRSSIGAVGVGSRPPAFQDGKSRFDQIVDGKASDRPRFRRKSMDMDLALSPEESAALKDRVMHARPPREGKGRHRRKSMDTRLSVEESEALRKKIDKSLRKAVSDDEGL